jgi:hypothetical protein
MKVYNISLGHGVVRYVTSQLPRYHDCVSARYPDDIAPPNRWSFTATLVVLF